MPLADGDVEGDAVAAGGEVDYFGYFAVIVIEDFTQMAAEADHCFGRFHMAVDGKRRSRLQGIQHSLAPVVGTIAEVKIHPEPGRGFGLGGEVVEELLVDDHCVEALFAC